MKRLYHLCSPVTGMKKHVTIQIGDKGNRRYHFYRKRKIYFHHAINYRFCLFYIHVDPSQQSLSLNLNEFILHNFGNSKIEPYIYYFHVMLLSPWKDAVFISLYKIYKSYKPHETPFVKNSVLFQSSNHTSKFPG